jgi:phosphomannomutase
MCEYLQEIYTKYGYFVTKNHYFINHEKPKMTQMFNEIRSPAYPEFVGKYKVKHIRDLTTGFDTSTADKKPTLPWSASSEMITFEFENGCMLTIRGSGTEPKIKYYAEISDPDPAKAKEILEDMINNAVVP